MRGKGSAVNPLFVLLLSTTLSVYAGPDFIVRVPGTVQQSQIKFSESLSLEPAQAKVIRPSIQDAYVPNRSEKNPMVETPKGNVVRLTNSERLNEIKSPVPVEAEVTLSDRGATITDVKPDSVAALNRLKTAKLKTISKKTQEQLDAAVRKVDDVTSDAIVGKAPPGKKAEILDAYDNLEDSLLNAFRQSTDYDDKRQLAKAIEGVNKEFLAWRQVELELTPKAAAAASPAATASERVPKSFTLPVFPDVVYDGFQASQQRVSTVFYKTIYESSRASAGIGIHGSNTFASGVLIGNGLVLTCAHTVIRPSKNGDPPPPRNVLDIRFGPDSPPDAASPYYECKAKVVFEGDSMETDQEPLDFALLETTKPFEKPISPLPLNVAPVAEGTKFFIAGHPYSKPRGVVDNGEVRFPFEIDEKTFERYKSQLVNEAINLPEQSLLERTFGRSYFGVLKNKHRYCYGRKSPAIGAICSVASGNSGGPAILRTEDGGVFGILVEGMEGNQIPYKPGWKNHEILLPISCVVDELDVKLRGWREKYNVTVVGETQ
jgi:hypothetical protein